MRYSNCLIWAVTQWLRKGGRIGYRRGLQFGGWYLHFMWRQTLDDQWLSFDAIKAKRFPWPLFRGRIVEDAVVQEMFSLQKGLGDKNTSKDGRNRERASNVDGM